MSRKREQRIPLEDETADRRGVLLWMGNSILRDASEQLGCTPQFLSRWLHHECEVSDLDVDHWVKITGVARYVFLEGRYESRKLSQAEEAAA